MLREIKNFRFASEDFNLDFFDSEAEIENKKQILRKKLEDKLSETLIEIRLITHEEWWIIREVVFNPVEHYHKIKERDRVKKILSTLLERILEKGDGE